MSIIGGLVDAHHEMELTPSSRLISSSWVARHLWTILLVGVAAVLYFAL
ncbi:MAG: hypothetical protein WCA78_14630 [Rhizomicrobium sp.]|jgi:hypothetical protein